MALPNGSAFFAKPSEQFQALGEYAWCDLWVAFSHNHFNLFVTNFKNVASRGIWVGQYLVQVSQNSQDSFPVACRGLC